MRAIPPPSFLLCGFGAVLSRGNTPFRERIRGRVAGTPRTIEKTRNIRPGKRKQRGHPKPNPRKRLQHNLKNKSRMAWLIFLRAWRTGTAAQKRVRAAAQVPKFLADIRSTSGDRHGPVLHENCQEEGN
jgi:hypothetical protein